MLIHRLLPRDWRGRRPEPRRLLAALLAAAAVASALTALSPRPAPRRPVWVAARDLTGGTPLRRGDLVIREVPIALLPRGALPVKTSLAGRMLAAPMREGEPVTDVRLLGPPLLGALARPDLVAVPVRVADGVAMTAVVRVGDTVDVLAGRSLDRAEPGAATGRVLLAGLHVLAVPAADTADGGGIVVLAATSADAARLAQSQLSDSLSLAVERR